MERMGATESREAMRIPLSQMQAVSRRDHVGSPLAFPWPKICKKTAQVCLKTTQKRVKFIKRSRFVFSLKSHITE